MGSLGGFAVGIVAGALLVGGAVAMTQPVKTRPRPEPVSMDNVPAKVKKYLTDQAPTVSGYQATLFATGDTELYTFTQDDAPEVITATLTQKGVLLNWRRNHLAWKAIVPEEVKEHFRAAMPDGHVLGYDDFDSVMYMYTALYERDGKGYKLMLSSVDGLEVEELADWQWKMYQEQFKDQK